MPSRRIEVPDSLRGRPFTGEEAATCGVSRRALYGPAYRLLWPGVHLTADTEADLAQRCRGLQLIAPGRILLSHVTAARLLELPLPVRLARVDAVDVVTAPGLVPHVAGVVGHERAERWRDGLQVGDLRVTAAHWIFCDLGQALTLVELVALGDALLRRGLATADSLRQAVLDSRGRRGVVRCRAALPFLDERTDSPRESEVRYLVICWGFPRPKANLDVFDEHGQWLCRPDLMWVELRVALQYDGLVHFGSPADRAEAAARDELLRSRGWEVIVVTNLDLRYPDRLRRRVGETLDRATREQRWKAYPPTYVSESPLVPVSWLPGWARCAVPSAALP